MNAASDTDFETLLAGASERLRAGETLDAVLAGVPAAQRAELEALLAVPSRLGVLRRDPRPEFAAALEARLMALPPPAPVASRWARALRGRTWLKVASVCAVVLVCLVGSGAFLTTASADSLPDSPLYPVRQAREWVELKLARSSTQQVSTYSTQIGNRGADLERALKLSKSQSIVQHVSDQAAASATKMVDVALRTQGDATTRPVARALVTLRFEQQRVARIAELTRPEVRAVLDQLVGELHDQELRLLAGIRPAGRAMKPQSHPSRRL